MDMIDLRSDTVTRPSEGMMEAMMNAKMGDDVFAEDPATNELQAYVADLFGMEAALFCPSGTMTNQIAAKLHTQPLDELVCHRLSHVNLYELGGHAFHSGLSIKPLDGEGGRLSPQQIAQCVNPSRDWLPTTRLVWLENTVNNAGGACYTLLQMEQLSQTARQHRLKIHLDGARIFNALEKTGASPRQVGALFDSVSVCLSKGLGAPVGSLLLGSRNFIRQARKVRKVMGGGMRQAGILAAAGLYALQNNIPLIETDHLHAQKLGDCLQSLHFVEKVLPVHTNILFFELKPSHNAFGLAELLEKEGIKTLAFDQKTMRLVTHLDFTAPMLEKTIQVLNSIKL